MPLFLTRTIQDLSRRVTGRDDDLFAADIERADPQIRNSVEGKRLLVVGGAGSIGSSTILQLLKYRPRAVSVLDTSENNIAELVRAIRSGPTRFEGELLVQPLDYGSALAERWLGTLPPHERVLSFAALKHVRSERDQFSALRLLDVNIAAADRFLDAIKKHGHGEEGVFFVSTDKAANPVSLMGASKRLMEHLLWCHHDGSLGSSPLKHTTTTRFANVAFSDGSLPWAFLQRLAKHEPLAAPSGIERFFVSPIEAAHLCILAAVATPPRHVLVPRLHATRDTRTFTKIAEHVLSARGLAPRYYESEADALDAVERDLADGHYPLLVTAGNTSGEKPYEEFLARGEKAVDIGMTQVEAIAGPEVSATDVARVIESIRSAVEGTTEVPDKKSVVRWLEELVPGLNHMETDASLDDRI